VPCGLQQVTKSARSAAARSRSSRARCRSPAAAPRSFGASEPDRLACSSARTGRDVRPLGRLPPRVGSRSGCPAEQRIDEVAVEVVRPSRAAATASRR
jgi:hypothetical protein